MTKGDKLFWLMFSSLLIGSILIGYTSYLFDKEDAMDNITYWQMLVCYSFGIYLLIDKMVRGK